MNKPLLRPVLNVEQKPDEERAQYLARKVAKYIRKEKWPDAVAALVGVAVHVLLRHSNDLEQALNNVDLLHNDMKQKLQAIWHPQKALDMAAQELDREFRKKAAMAGEQIAKAIDPDGRPQ